MLKLEGKLKKLSRRRRIKRRVYSFVRLVMTGIPSLVGLCVSFSGAVTHHNTHTQSGY